MGTWNQVLQNKIKLISSEKKLPQLFNLIYSPVGGATERYQKGRIKKGRDREPIPVTIGLYVARNL
jgi:hypothetical protein